MAGKYTPYIVNVELTLRCNLRCIHCGSGAGAPRKHELSRDELGAFFRDVAALGCRELCLLGGEPFLHPDWEALAAEAVELGLAVLFISNGLLLDGKMVERLKKLPGVDRIGISLDAAREEVHDRIRGKKGSFQKALRALFLLRDAGFETGAITTISRMNFGELEAMRELLLDRNLSWQLQVVSDHAARFSSDQLLSPQQFYEVGRFISRCRNEYDVNRLPVAGSHDLGYFSNVLTRYSELPDWKGCGAGLYTLGLMSDGSVKGCLSMHDDFIEDNIRNRSVRELWEDPELFQRNRAFSVEKLEGYCRACAHGAVCRAGCADLAYCLSGSTYNNPYCFHRLEVERIARQAAEAGE